MNIVVIGLGSMGKRRIRLIMEMYPKFIVFGVDSRNDRRSEVIEEFGVTCYKSIGEMNEIIDCAFICTTPLSHSSIINDCLKRGWHVFTELNLVPDGYDDNMELAKQKNCVLFLSSTFIYREEMKYIRSQISSKKKWNYIYHIGQYLPDWHPWENYQEMFLSDKRTNGCREIMALEIPWLINAFGEIVNIHVLSDKMTGLQVDYNDNYMLQLTHDNGNKGTMIVDIVSPCATRKLEVYAEHCYYSWDGTPESLKAYNSETKQLEHIKLDERAEHAEGYREFVVENAYKNEINGFFNAVLHNQEPLYGFEQDHKVLTLIESIGA